MAKKKGLYGVVYIRKNSLKNALDATKRTEINTRKEWVNTEEKVKKENNLF